MGTTLYCGRTSLLWCVTSIYRNRTALYCGGHPYTRILLEDHDTVLI